MCRGTLAVFVVAWLGNASSVGIRRLEVDRRRDAHVQKHANRDCPPHECESTRTLDASTSELRPWPNLPPTPNRPNCNVIMRRTIGLVCAWIAGVNVGCGKLATSPVAGDAGAQAQCFIGAPSPDAAFHSGAMNISSNAVNTFAIAADSSGRWLLAGSEGHGAGRPWVMRLTPIGDPDPSFGNNGFVEFPIGDIQDVAYSVHEDGAGRVLVGGTTESASLVSAFVARLTPSGALDTTFASTSPRPGILVLDSSFQGAPVAFADDSSGIYVAAENDAKPSGFLLRLTLDGTVDSTFAPVRSAKFGLHNPIIARDGVYYDNGPLLWKVDRAGNPDSAFGGRCIGGSCAPPGAALLPPKSREHCVVGLEDGVVAVSDQLPSKLRAFTHAGDLMFDDRSSPVGANAVAVACNRIMAAGWDGQGNVGAVAVGLDGLPVAGDPPATIWAFQPSSNPQLLVTAIDRRTGRIVFAQDVLPAGTIFIAGYHL